MEGSSKQEDQMLNSLELDMELTWNLNPIKNHTGVILVHFQEYPKKYYALWHLTNLWERSIYTDILRIRANTKPLQTFYIRQILLGAKAQLQNLTSARSYIDHNFIKYAEYFMQPVDQNKGGEEAKYLVQLEEKWETGRISNKMFSRKLLEEVQNIVGWLLPHSWHWHS